MEKSSFKKALPVFLGNTLEYYDFCLYGLLAPVFARIFFPPDFKENLIAAFFLFSIAYVARPVGALFWGYLADKYGRKPVLISTLTMMSIPAIGMAITPSYESIGIFASIIVILLRFFQGISYSGELAATMVVSYEISSNNKGKLGSFVEIFGLFGYFTGLCLLIFLSCLLDQKQIDSFGWRILFLASIVFIAIVAYIRLNVIETRPPAKFNSLPIFLIFKQHIKTIIIMFSYSMMASCLYYDCLFYNYTLIQRSTVIFDSIYQVQMIVIIYLVFLMYLIGVASDKINCLKIARNLYIILLFLAVPIYIFLFKGIIYIVLSYIILGFFTAFSVATHTLLLVHQTPQNYRVSCAAISVSISAILCSFIPMINEILIETTHLAYSPAFPIIFCALISIVATYFMKPNKK